MASVASRPPNPLRDGGVDVALLGDTLLESENIPTLDEDLAVPSRPLLEGGWVDTLLLEGAEFGPIRLLPGDSVFFEDPGVDDPKLQLLRVGMLLVVEEPNSAKLGITESF